MSKKLIELYSDMPTNSIVDCKMAGDLILVSNEDAFKLIDIFYKDQVEFVLYDVGDLLIDKSYEYWE